MFTGGLLVIYNSVTMLTRFYVYVIMLTLRKQYLLTNLEGGETHSVRSKSVECKQ